MNLNNALVKQIIVIEETLGKEELYLYNWWYSKSVSLKLKHVSESPGGLV